MTFLLGWLIFRGYVKLPGGKRNTNMAGQVKAGGLKCPKCPFLPRQMIIEELVYLAWTLIPIGSMYGIYPYICLNGKCRQMYHTYIHGCIWDICKLSNFSARLWRNPIILVFGITCLSLDFFVPSGGQASFGSFVTAPGHPKHGR